jgi:hypothetical protein
MLNPELSHRFVGSATWTLALPQTEEIGSLIPPIRGPVASMGKVLGNRSTLYKYLNPHLLGLTTSTPKQKSCGVYLVDAAKGSIVYHARFPASAGRGCEDVKMTITENWLVYSYFEEEVLGVGGGKGYRVVSVEFYEGVKADDKIRRYVEFFFGL